MFATGRRTFGWLMLATPTAITPAATAAQHAHQVAPATVQIPEAIRTEHAQLHAALLAATHASGRVGEAARGVARVLEPHFAREEQIALPPLGLLADLAHGAVSRSMADVLPLTDSLKAELPHMLEEHVAIAAAVKHFRDAARAAGALEYADLAEKIMLHAQTEEQVTYPAAILVGEYVRLRLGRPH